MNKPVDIKTPDVKIKHKRVKMSCGCRLTESEILKAAATIMSSRVKNRKPGPGRPKTLKPCRKCGKTFGSNREKGRHKCGK
jgi:hypothetical protein